jgi:hypothetical protein
MVESRKLRFRLRTLLLVITAFCIWLGLHVRDARRQQQAVKAVLAVRSRISSPRIEYRHQFTRRGQPITGQGEPIWPTWLLKLFGEDLFLTAVGVSFDGTNASDADLKPLVSLSHLHRLDLEYTTITDNGLAFIDSHFPSITRLDLQDTQISGAGLKHVAALKHLEILLLGKLEASSQELRSIASLSNLQSLAIRQSKLEDGALKFLPTLTNLKSLDLRYTPLADSIVEPLSEMAHLDELTLIDTGLSPETIERLRALLPQCKVIADE